MVFPPLFMIFTAALKMASILTPLCSKKLVSSIATKASIRRGGSYS